jgi:hypothetical protein
MASQSTKTKWYTDGVSIDECPHVLVTQGHGKVVNTDACMYCGKDDFNFLVFSTEFDWLIHLCCVVKAILEELTKGDTAEMAEYEILMEEFKITHKDVMV